MQRSAFRPHKPRGHRFESDSRHVLNNAHDRRRRKDHNDTTSQLNRIYKRDRGVCQLCGKPCKREDASRDHIKDLRSLTIAEAKLLRGDEHVRLAHIRCNNRKTNYPGSHLIYEPIAIYEQQEISEIISPLTFTIGEQWKLDNHFDSGR